MPNNGTISQTMDGINTTSVTIPSGYTQGGSISLDNTIGNEVTIQTDLIAQIAATVDELPEAGGGGSNIELATVSLTVNDRKSSGLMYYTDSNFSLLLGKRVSVYYPSATIEIPKNTIVYFEKCSVTPSGDAGSLTPTQSSGGVFIIYNDCSFTI
jgi:archaellin